MDAGKPKKGRPGWPGRPDAYGQRRLSAVILRWYYSGYLALIGAEQITSEDLDHAVLDLRAAVLLQRRAEIGQVGQFVECGVDVPP